MPLSFLILGEYMKLNKKEFLTELKSNRIDVNMSTYMENAFSFSDAFGTKYNYSSAKEMKARLELIIKESLEQWSYEQGYWISSKVESKTASVIEKAPEVIKVKEEEEEEEVKEVVIETNTSNKAVDWDWINTLKNTKEDKKALDEYAEDDHSIKLKRTMSLENMIKDFKEKLGE